MTGLLLEDGQNNSEVAERSTYTERSLSVYVAHFDQVWWSVFRVHLNHLQHTHTHKTESVLFYGTSCNKIQALLKTFVTPVTFHSLLLSRDRVKV